MRVAGFEVVRMTTSVCQVQESSQADVILESVQINSEDEDESLFSAASLGLISYDGHPQNL